jgi:hypothetical protein
MRVARPRSRRWFGILVTVAVLAVACGDQGDGFQPEAVGARGCSPEYAASGNVSEPGARPVGSSEIQEDTASALPPAHLDTEVFPEALIPREAVVRGGPPPDGIPPIDDPRYLSVEETTFLCDQEPVVVLEVNGDARAYPIQIMTWHEIVNDIVGDEPVTVSYCPLCNSALAYRREVDGQVLDFGTSGSLYQSALLMYDRQTESLWTHFDGRAVIGELVGSELDVIPMATVSWADFKAAHPEGQVLSWETGHARDYGRNPYQGYDRRLGPFDHFFEGDVDGRLGAQDRVVGITGDQGPLAVDRTQLAAESVIGVEDGATQLTVWLKPGTASSLDANVLADGADIGAVGVFVNDVDGEPLTFRTGGDGFVDDETGSTWNILGQATGGPLEGTQLEPVTHADTFWFAWATYHPETVLVP